MDKLFIHGINPNLVETWYYSATQECEDCAGYGYTEHQVRVDVFNKKGCHKCQGTGRIDKPVFWCRFASGEERRTAGPQAERMADLFQEITIGKGAYNG